MEKEFQLKGEYIKLEQILKIFGVLEKGGQAKVYLAENPVKVNDHSENRRGAKIRKGDTVTVEDLVIKII